MTLITASAFHSPSSISAARYPPCVSTFRLGIRANGMAASATLWSATAFRNWSKGASKVRPCQGSGLVDGDADRYAMA